MMGRLLIRCGNVSTFNDSGSIGLDGSYMPFPGPSGTGDLCILDGPSVLYVALQKTTQ